MAIQWSGTSGRMQVGIDVRTGSITTSTTSTTVWVDYWVRSINWAYADNQWVQTRGSGQGARFDYYMSSPNGVVTAQFVGTVTLSGQGLSYSGGPNYTFGAQIGGAYDGSSPSFDIAWRLPARPANTPTAPGLSVTSVTNSTARINVSASDGRGSAVNLYQAWVSSNSGFTGIVDSHSGGSFTATGLSPATRYWARARARNGVGYSDYSTVRSFVTSATTPSAPTGLGSSAIGVGQATVAWTAPASDGGSDIDEYQIQYAKNSSFSLSPVVVEDEASPRILTDLDAATQYWYRVRAINGVGAGAWSSAGTFTTLQGTPTITSPAASAVRTTSEFDFTIALAGAKSDTTITVEASQASDFSTGIVTRTVAASAALVGGTTYRVRSTTAGAYLKTGSWFVRARAATPSASYTSPWSTTVAFSQSHQPSALLNTPETGKVVQYISPMVFNWSFVDTGLASPLEGQSAYQLVIEDSISNAVIFDSGKVTSSSLTDSVVIASANKGIPLRWRVRVWDAGDSASAWTGYNLFTMTDPPVVTIVEPTPAVDITTGAPRVSWEFSAPSTGFQQEARVSFTDIASGEIVWTDITLGGVTFVQPDRVVLVNDREYMLSVTVTDSYGLTTVASQNYTTDYVAPEPISYDVDASLIDEIGYVLVSWPNAIPDQEFIAWKVYRRTSVTDEWQSIARISGQSVREYRDYMVSADSSFMYSVTQVAYRFGVELESPVGYRVVFDSSGTPENVHEDRLLYVDITKYWIINPDDPDLSVQLPGVTDDPSSVEYETATYTIVGRGRHRDYGDRLGITGTLTVQVRNLERRSSLRAKVNALRDANETYYLRTPFGGLFPVALGNIGWTPLKGTGTSEMGDMSIPYEEVG